MANGFHHWCETYFRTMKSCFLFCLVIVFGSCVWRSDDYNSTSINVHPRVKLTDRSEVFDSAYYDTFNFKNIERGRDTLNYYLSQVEYDSSLFYAYYALTFAYLNLEEFQKADSVHNLIDRVELDSLEEMEWLDNAFELSIHSCNFKQALIINDNLYRHPADLSPVWLKKYTYIYNKWLIFSLMQNCDSAKGYLGAYLAAIEKLDQVREWEGIDSVKISYFENQYKNSCPFIDSVGLSLPTIVIYQ